MGARSRHVIWWDPWSGSAREMHMYRVTKFRGSINKTPFMAKIGLRAPGVSRGGCWCDRSGYGSSLYLIQLKYIVWGKCTTSAECIIYPDSRACG